MAQRFDFAFESNLGNVADPLLAQDAATKNYVDTRPSTGGGLVYAFQIQTPWQNPPQAQYGGSVTNFVPNPTSGRIEQSAWAGATIPNTGTSIQILQSIVYNSITAPMVGDRIYAELPFETQLSGSLLLNTNSTITNLFARIQFQTIHFAGMPNQIITERYQIVNAPMSGNFLSVPLVGFSSTTILEPNPDTSDPFYPNYDGTIPLQINFNVEFFTTAALAQDLNQAPVAIPSNTTLNSGLLWSPSITFTQSYGNLNDFGTRTLENGVDVRVTESGDTRITDQFVV